MAFDGFVISNLVYELNNTILNAKISKIAQPETDELLFTLKGSNGQYRRQQTESAHRAEFLHASAQAYRKRADRGDQPAAHGAHHQL